MKENKLENLISIYNSYSRRIIITDDKLKILWKNFETRDDSENLSKENFTLSFRGKKRAEFPILEETSLFFKFDKRNYNVSVIPTLENGELLGYIIEMYNLPDTYRFYKNADLCGLEGKHFAVEKIGVFGVTSNAEALKMELERCERYDLIEKYILPQMDSCYKILRARCNHNECVKYSAGDFNVEAIDLVATVKEIVETCKRITAGNNIEISFEGDGEAVVETDIDRLTSVIMNLIVNSVQNSTEDLKKVLVKVSKIDNSAVLTISDNGFGVEAEHLRDGFELCDESETLDNEGLGLYVVKLFCETFGYIMYNSYSNERTAISVKMPISKKGLNGTQFRSKVSTMGLDRFSTVYQYMSKIVKINRF